MIPAAFDYVRPGSLDEALDALVADDAAVLAGGHSLVPMLKLRLARPSVLVDVRGVLPRGVSREQSTVAIGAVTTWRELTAADALVGPLELVRECAGAIGDLQVRNHGTVGGSLAHADPASDFAAASVAAGARLRLVSSGGEREVAAADFFVGPFTTALQRAELIAEVVLPLEPSRGSAYEAVEDPASGYPLAGAAASVERDGPRLVDCRIAVTGVAGTPLRLRAAEAVALAEGLEAVAEAAARELEGADVIGDVRADPPFRRRVAAVVVSRALARAARRADEAR